MVKYTRRALQLLLLTAITRANGLLLAPIGNHPQQLSSSSSFFSRRHLSAAASSSSSSSSSQQQPLDQFDNSISNNNNNINININNDGTGEKLFTAVENLSASAMETMTEAIQWDDADENADFEATLELQKRRMQQRLGIRTVQLKLLLSHTNTASPNTANNNGIMGIRLGQVEPGFNLLDKTLDIDTLQYTQRRQQSSTVSKPSESEPSDDSDALLRKSVDGNFKGVVVLSVDKDGQGWGVGIRPGDVLTASSATMGDAMWPKKSLEGVKSAIASRKAVGSSTLDLQFRVDGKTDGAGGVPQTKVDNQYELTLTRPIGIDVGEKDGYVVVTGFNGNAAKLVRSAMLEGDRIVAVASSFGDRLWPVSTVEGVISACTSRLPGQKVTMRLERPIENLGKVTANAAPAAAASATAVPSVVQHIKTQTSSESTPMSLEKRARLMKGCREVLRRYWSENSDKSTFVGKYAVPVMVADKVIDAVASASTSFDAITLSMVMNAFLSCNQADGAIRIFEAATGIKSNGSNDAVETIIIGKDNGTLVASPDALNLYTASSLMHALAMNGDVSSAKRILAALEGRGGTIVDAKEVAVWPQTGVAGTIVPDAMCYNIALKAASMAPGGLQDLLSIFTSMNDGKANGRPAKDIVSYNTVIVALTNAGRQTEAFDMFSRMKKAGIKPDKFTYTSLIKACSRPIDMQELLYDMKEKGVKPDIVTYNTMIRTLCDRLQWYEAKKLIADMEHNGIAANSMTYGFLMSGLMKAEKYSAALILFESACADSRTTPLTENVQLYTSAITAAASLRNHEKAFDLVNRMTMTGVRPNHKTMTALISSCLSSGVPNLAVEVYKKMDKPDGIAMSKGLEAMCYEGMFEEVATALHQQWRKRDCVMSGKQIMDGYTQLLRQALQQSDLAFARKALTEFLQMGFIPSKVMYQTIIQALEMVPPKKKDMPFAKEIPQERFDFLLFVLDITQGRNLSVDGLFYSNLLSSAARMGPLRRKLGSLIAEARATSNSDTVLVTDDDGTNNDDSDHVKIGWEDFLRNYDDYKGDKNVHLPPLSVNINKAVVKSVLFAEALVTYNGVRKSSSSSRREQKPKTFVAAATN